MGGLGAPGRSTVAPWAQPDEATRRQLIADVGHDLRTPLAITLALADRILAREALPHAVRRDVEAARRNAHAMLAQVEDLLRVASADLRNAPHLQPCDLARLVAGLTAAFEPLAAARAVTLASDVPATLPVLADRRRIAVLVTNLLSNALKFTPPGGVVRVALHGPAPRTRLEVADSGPGVPQRLRARVFERFAQDDGEGGLRERGLGIGLAIVRDVVAVHGGRVRVGDAPEGGALFVVDLPLRAPLVAPDHERPSEALVRPALERLAVELEGRDAALETRIDPGELPLLLLVDEDSERAARCTAALEEAYGVAHATGLDAALAQLLA
ncbi:MAG TPA: HAMP domain-containing sensor histidine kinase, partial [Solirubrobacteraceae bacterium]|nr:HAMP domain-containing sensor histidine kinase [Solirubrobacteraceae bacterium]